MIESSWLITTLWSLVVFLMGGFLGDIKGKLSINSLRDKLEKHEKLETHPQGAQRIEFLEKRFEELITMIKELNLTIKELDKKVDGLRERENR